jgi:hypothetical protein
MDLKNLEAEKKEINYDPSKKETKIRDYVNKRIESMKQYRTESKCENR